MKERIIVFGLKITGMSSAKALSKLGYKVLVYSDNKDDDFYKAISEMRDYDIEVIEALDEIDFTNIKYLLKSPGIKLDNPFIKLAHANDIEVVSDIELAFRLWDDIKFVAITGTNGKTTTTHMISNILTASNIKNQIVGNIGVGLLWQVVNLGLDTIYVLEMSSFQLASSNTFRASVSCLTNISPDHIDWHGSYEEYIRCKLQITKNQTKDDTIIVNADDFSNELVKDLTEAKVREISTKKGILNGTYCLDSDIFIDNKKSIISRSDIKLVGEHNVQNALFAIEASLSMGISQENIKKGIQSLRPIEHRIEETRDIDGVKYYNDSKGTNVDSTIKALDGFSNPIILIAGGYDKKADYRQLFVGRDNIKNLILFGQTKYDIQGVAKKFNLNITICDDLEECVKKANGLAESGDVVLFSPACASWDMYKNFEERGKHFKELVKNLWKNGIVKGSILTGRLPCWLF